MIRNKVLILALAFTINIFAYSSVLFAQESDESLIQCRIPKYGVKFLCDHRWKVSESEELIIFELSRDPVIRLTVSSLKTKFKFVNQLTKEFFEEQNIYQDGFVILNETISEKPCLRIQAFYKNDPNIRFVDYFFFYKGDLIRVLITVDPKEAWKDYNQGLQKIIDSLEIMDE